MSRYATIVPEWVGETCFILGCGPSIAGSSYRSLQSHGKVIAINDSFLLCPEADALYFADQSFWNDYYNEIQLSFRGRRVITHENQIKGVLALRNAGCEG